MRISISRKNKQTGEYEQDFSDWVSAVGTSAAKKAACLTQGCRIKLGDIDTTNHYDEQKKVKYTNHKVFSFELADGDTPAPKSNNTEPQPSVDSGEVDDARLPF